MRACSEVSGKQLIESLIRLVVVDEARPELVAEFAALRVLKRRGRQLIPAPHRERLNLCEMSNSLWVVYGSIAQAADDSLVIESLNIGPALPAQLSRPGLDLAHGITSPLHSPTSGPTAATASSSTCPPKTSSATGPSHAPPRQQGPQQRRLYRPRRGGFGGLEATSPRGGHRMNLHAK